MHKKPRIFTTFLISIGAISIILLFVFSIISGFAYSKFDQCKKILEQVKVELDLPGNSCNLKLNNASLYEVITDPYNNIKNKELEYNSRVKVFEDSKQILKTNLDIISTLNIKIENQINPHVPLYTKDGYLQATTETNQDIKFLQNKIENYKSLIDNKNIFLKTKIDEAKVQNVDTSRFEIVYNSLKQSDLTSVENASKIHLLEQNVFEYTKEINKEILIKNPNYISQFTVNFPILTYHRIEDYDNLPKSLKSNARREITVSPKDFTDQLDLLAQKGYQTVTLQDIEQAVINKNVEFFVGNKIMLTFDDGYSEHYKIVFPELKKRNMKGVFGIVPNFRGIEWSHIKEMSDNGMEIVSHTMSHCPLATYNSLDRAKNPEGGIYQACSNKSYGAKEKMMPIEEVKFELVESKKILEEKLGKPVKFLIYPYGSFNIQVEEIVQASGYTLALRVGTGPKINLINHFELSRVNVSGFNKGLEGWFAEINK